jgi:uncharacterized protein YdhG (YjbR/CyaY superfamily)
VTGSAEVDAHLSRIPEPQRSTLQLLREQIRAAAPKATESIAYGMPAFRLGERFLFSYEAYRDHCSLFPASGAIRSALGDELKPNLSGKATIQFTTDAPLAPSIVSRIVAARLAELNQDLDA